MLTRWRPLYEKKSIPFGKASLKLGLTPNFWTLFSLLSAVLSGAALAFGFYGFGLLALLVMNITDMLDGATARAGNICTDFGTVLDHTCDRYGEFCLYAGLMLGGAISPALGLFTASGVVMASYVRAKAESAGKLKSCNVGFAGRQEKLILTILGLILFWLNFSLAGQVCVFLAGLISHITAVQRLIYARDQILNPAAK
ncbi:MAG TPA: CDP-alcohol phosphatidyltransferase family protein [Anaerolineaceae bacterium]|jgi:phosphatidylglycerophosphate synthase